MNDRPLDKTILDEAAEVVFGDREATYGHPSINLERIAAMWAVVFGHPVTLEQVCHAMIAVKLARAIHSPSHRDTMTDICGYAALLDRCGRLK